MEDKDAAFLVEVLETTLEEDMDSIILQEEVLRKPNQLKTVWDLNVNKTMFMETLEDWDLGPHYAPKCPICTPFSNNFF